MPLPSVRSGESQNSYIGRCSSFVFGEGTLGGKPVNPKSEKDRARVVAACGSTWRRAHGQKDDDNLKQEEDYEVSGNHQDYVPQENVMSKSFAFMQIHFTDVEEDTYKELQKADKLLWNHLSMNYPSHVDFRIYNQETDEIDTIHMQMMSEGDIKKAKNYFNKCESFWLEPKSGDDKYSYMALIWSDDVNREV